MNIIKVFFFAKILYKHRQNKGRYDTKHGIFRHLKTVKTDTDCPVRKDIRVRIT